jgi:type II secretory pathway component PulJ
VKNRERGATLVELLVSISIWGLVALAVTGSIFLILRNASINSNHMSALIQLQRADQFISQDARMAQIITVENLSTPDILVMNWIDGCSGDEYEVTYKLETFGGSSLKQLKRYLYVNGSSNTTSVVAGYIDPSPELTNCQFGEGVLTLTITAAVGGGSSEKIETRTYKVVSRPG